jgi:sigma-B regulation protein RsbU (phosphoserine phosphatase)
LGLDPVIAVVFLACGVLLLFIAILVLREDPGKRINRVTGLMFGFAALGPLFHAIGVFIGDTISTRSWLYNTQYVWELFFPQLVFFALCFPVQTDFYNRWRRLKYIIFVPHIFHILLTTVFADPDKLLQWFDPSEMGTVGRTLLAPLEPVVIIMGAAFSALLDGHTKLFSTVNFAYVIIATAILWRGIKSVVAPQLRKQVVIVIYGIVSALALYVVAFILPALNIIELSAGLRQTLTIIALVLACGSIVWAIVRYRFMDVRLIVRQSLVYSVSSALVVGAYVLILRQLGDIIRSVFGAQIPALDVIFIVIALLLFQPVMSQVDDLIRRFFIRDKGDYRNISQNFSRQVASVFGTKELFDLTFSVLKDQLLFERAYICLRDGRDAKLCFVAQTESGADEATYLEPEENFLRAVSRRQGIANFDEVRSEAPPSELSDFVAKLKIRYLAPLVSGDGFLGFLGVTDKISGYRVNYEDITTLITISNQLAIAVTTSRLYQESIEKQRLEQEMGFARAIQRDLLPKEFPHGPTFSFTAYSQPSRDVGGDYFDFIPADNNRVNVVLADVSGKGIAAALLASQLQAAMRSEVRHQVGLPAMLSNVNELIYDSTSQDRFATLFVADFDPSTHRLLYSNAGHNYPIHLSEDEHVNSLDQGGLLLGAFPGCTYDQGELVLRPGDIVLFYTDGLNEAENEAGEQYGEDRILEFMRRHRDLSPEEIQTKLVKEIKEFVGGASLQDDMTLIVMKVNNDVQKGPDL